MIPLTDSLPATNRFRLRVQLSPDWSIEGEVPALTPDDARRIARAEISLHFPEWAEILSSPNINVEVLGTCL